MGNTSKKTISNVVLSKHNPNELEEMTESYLQKFTRRWRSLNNNVSSLHQRLEYHASKGQKYLTRMWIMRQIPTGGMRVYE